VTCRRSTPILAVLGALAIATVVPAAPPHKRLATQLARDATTLVKSEPLLMPSLEGAIVVAKEAAVLDPEDPDSWRLLLQLADLAERPDIEAEAVASLLELDPSDEVVRLRYIHLVVDRRQTVEERVSIYEQLLSPAAREQLGPAVASRIAADYAVLLRRAGDTDGFARWIGEAVVLDPANREAAATAAGFFRLNVDDPFAEAELLVTALMADPASLGTQLALARVLLEHGAYTGADRLYRIATRYHAVGRQGVQGGLIADWALAQWGAGDAAAALTTVQARQREMDTAHRYKAKRADPKLTPLDLARLPPAPLAGTLATVRAAIHQRLGDEQAGPAFRAAMAAYQSEITELQSRDKLDTAALTARYLEAAWVALWIGSDVEQAKSFLDSARALLPDGRMELAAEARFAGWLALREGDLARAEAILAVQHEADADSVSRLGLALTLHAQGRRADAARHLLAVARERPGALVGVWAADVLAELLGVRLGPTDEASRLDALVNSLPTILDRLADEPTLALGIRVQPVKLTYEPFEPIIVNLEITNHASFPLAVSAGGPIKPHVALLPVVRIAQNPGVGAVPPQIVEIDRRLTLEPNERLVIPVDLRRGELYTVLNALPLPGATMSVRAVCNFIATSSGNIEPGVLGSEIETPPFRVDGARVSGEWISRAMAAALEPHSRSDLSDVALLAHAVARFTELGNASRPGLQRAAVDGLQALGEAFRKLDTVSQAWLVCVMPASQVIEPVRELARAHDDRLVRLAFLLHSLRGLDDPMLVAALNDDDPTLRAVGKLMKLGLERARQARTSQGG
jgi:tetratricopeptide (TPR) repeat protein